MLAWFCVNYTQWVNFMKEEHIYTDNCEGVYYVNAACIACDTCTDISPLHFKLTSDFDHAYVLAQPDTQDQVQLCDDALVACPVAAIGKR